MKKIIAVLLMAALLLGAVPAYAASASVHVEVTPSVAEAEVGDTVEFVITAQAEGLVAMQFEVRMPEGLSYVSGSGASPKDLAQRLGVPAAEWTEASMMFTFYNDVGIKMTKGTELVRFSCVAEKAGDWDVIIHELLPFDGDFAEFAPELTVHTLRVNGTEAPATTPAASEPTISTGNAPEEVTTAATAPAPEVSAPVTGSTVPEPGIPDATDPAPEATVSGEPGTIATSPVVGEPVITAPDQSQEVTGESQPEGETLPAQAPTAEDLPLDMDIQENQGNAQDSGLTGPEAAEQDGIQETGDPQTDEDQPEKKSWPWILAAAIVAAGAAGVFFFLRKKKASEEEK